MRASIVRFGAWVMLPALALLVLAGCWDRKELNDLALVTAAAIDRTEDDAIVLSVQLFVPRAGMSNQMGSIGTSGGDDMTVVRSAKGKTIAAAMSRLQERFPRKIFWGHSEALIFGESTAKSGIRELVDFFLRFPQPREHANVFVSKGEAKKILELLPPIERNQAEALRELSRSRVGLRITLMDLAEMLISDPGHAVLPLLAILPPPEGKGPQQTIANITGTAVFREDRLIGTLNQQLSRGLLWLRDEIRYSVVTFSPEGSDGYLSFYLLRSHTKLVPRIEGERWSMTVKIRTENDVIENTTALDLLEPDVTRKLEAELERAIERRVGQALERLQHVLRTDVMGFADAFHRKYPREWRKVRDRWDKKLPEVEVGVEVDANILRPGESGSIVTRSGNGKRP